MCSLIVKRWWDQYELLPWPGKGSDGCVPLTLSTLLCNKIFSQKPDKKVKSLLKGFLYWKDVLFWLLWVCIVGLCFTNIKFIILNGILDFYLHYNVCGFIPTKYLKVYGHSGKYSREVKRKFDDVCGQREYFRRKFQRWARDNIAATKWPSIHFLIIVCSIFVVASPIIHRSLKGIVSRD